MKKAKMLLLVGLAAILSLGMSCSRTPETDGTTSPAGSSSVDANGASPKQPHESTDHAHLSTRNQVSVEAGTRHPQDGKDDPSAVDFIGVAIDLNSGDLRGTRSIVDGPPRYVICESELSKEVRRLGIPIPEERRWMPISRPFSGGMEVYYICEPLLPAARQLLTLLDEVKATDQERRDVLEGLMLSLRTEKPSAAIEKAYMLTIEVCDRHGSENPFSPEFTEQLRSSRSR